MPCKFYDLENILLHFSKRLKNLENPNWNELMEIIYPLINPIKAKAHNLDNYQ